jgi:RND family efflux transporter MFP subunit
MVSCGADEDPAAPEANGPPARGGGGRGGFGRGGFGGQRPPMTVELGNATRGLVTEELTVVGTLIGAATVEVAPKVSGRLEAIRVRLGDPVRRGELIARVEDEQFLQQVKQAEASFAVAGATVRQRDADLAFAQTNLERSQNLFEQDLLSSQDIDDAQARHQAAVAQRDLALAQLAQAEARLEELRITLDNTEIRSPVDGFVGRRHLDPGAFVTSSTPVVSVVDISFVRLVVNLVEKDLRRVRAGVAANVEVDAYPDETFNGQVARIAPILNPATRTAEMEIEIPNPDFRLKPGMYARVDLLVAERPDALVVPRNAVVSVDNRRGVFVVNDDGSTVRFQEVTTGIENQERAEILTGLDEGMQVVTTGAAGLRDDARIIVAGAPAGAGGRGGMRAGGRAADGERGTPGGSGRPAGPPDVTAGGGQRPAGADDRAGSGQRPPPTP